MRGDCRAAWPGALAVLLIAVTACGSAGSPASTPTVAPSSTPTPSPSTTPRVGPEPLGIVAVSYGPGGARVSVVAADGRVSGTADVAAVSPGSGGQEIAVAPGGAVFAQNGRLAELTLAGTVIDRGPLPANFPSSDRPFAVSPDGESLAYSTQVSLDGRPTHDYGTYRNQLWVVRLGSAPRLLADRAVTDTVAPSDAPRRWQYRVLGWSSLGILIVREPFGVGGGDAPFAGESLWGYTAVVDPETGGSTPVTSGTACTYSDLAWDGTSVCIGRREAGSVSQATSITVTPAGRAPVVRSLDGASWAGEARSDPTRNRVAFATAGSGWQVGTWEAATTLRILDVASGRITAVGPSGLHPMAWLRDGRLLAVRYEHRGGATPGPGSTEAFWMSLVSVDATSGAVSSLGAFSGWPIGVIEGG